MTAKPWLSVKEAMAALGMGKYAVMALIENGDLVAHPQHTKGGVVYRWLVDPDSVNELHRRLAERHRASKRRVERFGRWAS